jgi:1-phosphofructokinase family hexose kinase
VILSITPNPDVEYDWSVPGIYLGGVFRVAEAIILPSGKGVNTARAIHTLGGQVTCAGFLAGHTGRLIAQLLSQMDIPAHWTWVEGESRISAAIVDPEQPGIDATLISESGPLVDCAAWDRLIREALSITGVQLACLCGSMPPGTPLDKVVDLIERLEASGIPVWVDTSGDALSAAVQARPSGIKINQLEAQDLTGTAVTDAQQARRVAETLLDQGIKMVSITMGKKGAVLCHPGEAWLGKAPEIIQLSSVGSGDAFLGGLLWSCIEGFGNADALRAAIAAGTANSLSMGGGRFTRKEFDERFLNIDVEKIW